MAKFKARLVSSKPETHDTQTLTLEAADRPDFRPGQFFMIEFMRKEKIPKRSYSVSSSPTRPGILEFTIKQMPDGWISKLLNEAPVGEEFMLDGPWGHFIFDEAKMQEIVQLAAGSGIAPFRCFLQYIIDKHLSTKVTLYYGNKTTEDIICHTELEGYASQIPGVKLQFCLSREEKDGFYFGRIDEKCISEVTKASPQAHYFVCGPPAMVTDTEKMLLDYGIAKEKIKTEKYG